MSQERLSVKKLKEVLRLHFECNLTNRKIAGALNLSPTTVGHYVSSAQKCGETWPSLSQLTDEPLQALLFPHCQQLSVNSEPTAKPDFSSVYNELKKKGVTREILHAEFKANNPTAQVMSYSAFCRQYRTFKKRLKPSMRQVHRAGEKIFVDYAGPTVPIYDANTGEVQRAMIFVGVLGASNYTFAEATLTRSLPDWIGSHVRMFEYFGGVTELIIPDNEKSAVNKACYYDPDVNPNYAALAAHYNTAVLPARPYHPKDKAKAEVGVQVTERWILAKLRHQKFFSLSELNAAISLLLEELNAKPFQKLSGSRLSWFETLDKPALKPLPKHAYAYKIIKKAMVNLDYHVEINRHYYSVPHRYLNQHVEYQITQNTVAIFCRGQRIALHMLSQQADGATTCPEHMPEAHRQHREWTPQKFIDWSHTVGPEMTAMAQQLVRDKPNPECCYRIHLGFMNLARRFGKTRLEEAGLYANKHQLWTYSHVLSILKTQCDKAPVIAKNQDYEDSNKSPCQHPNLRGPHYYSHKPGEKHK